ncbi:MAG: hypothetical protein K8W52_35305, partial [Deltaproteobacteria bacterium]|nr:hypothetical protein [Deltaproteobacteria bacterium]
RLHGAEARVSQRALPPAAAPAARVGAVDRHALADARPVTHAQVAGHRPFDNVVPDTGDLELELLGLSDGPAPAGTAELAAEDGSVTRSASLAGATRRADGSAVVAFKDVKPGRYVVDVIPAKGARYRVIAPIAIRKHDLRTSSAPGRSLTMQSVRVVYDDAPTKPATDKHVDLKLGDAWIAVATNEVGALVIADTAAPKKKGKKASGKPAPGRRGGLRSERPIKAGAPPASSGEPLWFAVNRTDLELAIAEHPPEVAGDPPEDARQTSAIAPAPSAATGVDDRAVRVRRIKLSLPLTVNFASLLDAQRFLARHPMRVDVDGMPVTCAVTIASPTRWQIDFPIGPGTHKVIVTSQELEPQGLIQPRRTIYFAREVTVGFGPPKLVAMMSAGPLTMMGTVPASATPSGHGPAQVTAASSHGPAKVGAASVEPPPSLDLRKSPR